MNRTNMGLSAILSATALAAITACSGGGTSPSSGGTSTLSVALVDAPFAMSGAMVTAVNLGIDKVEVVGGGAQPAVVASFTTPDVVNILQYTSASSALTFPAASIPAGSYQQIRFVLDSATTTIAYTDSTGQHVAPLTVPSGTVGGFGNASSTDAGDGQGTSGFKVNVALDASANYTYGYILDFNAAQSIVAAGPKFILKPVIVATALATSGAIGGTVQNTAGTAVAGAEVDAQQNGMTVNSGITAADGTFAINALPVGVYSLLVKNTGTTSAGNTFTATGFDGTAAANPTVTVPGTITVTAGATASAGIVKD